MSQTQDRYEDTAKQFFPYTNKFNSPQRDQSLSNNSVNTRNQDNVYTQSSPRDYQNRDIEDRLSTYQQSDGNTIKTVDSRNESPVQNYPIIAIHKNRNSNEIRQKPFVPPKPSSNRSSMQPVATVERSDSRNSNPPDVLRGQLPWSYFKSSKDVPKKAFQHVVEEPVPDYPMFPRPKFVGDQEGGKFYILISSTLQQFPIFHSSLEWPGASLLKK